MTHIANSAAQILALIDDLDLVFPAEWDVPLLVKAVQRDALDDFLSIGTYDDEDMLYLPLKMGYGEKGMRGKALTRQLREDADLIAAIATIAGEVAWHAEQVGTRGTAAEVMAMVQSLFGKGAARGAAVRRCTIHKAKGLEAARVAVLEADEVLDAGRADAQPGDRALAFVRSRG